MNILEFLRLKKPIAEPPKLCLLPVGSVPRLRHEKIISNLELEYEDLMVKLTNLELDEKISRLDKEKQSNQLIYKMTHIKYEIEIRKELL